MNKSTRTLFLGLFLIVFTFPMVMGVTDFPNDLPPSFEYNFNGDLEDDVGSNDFSEGASSCTSTGTSYNCTDPGYLVTGSALGISGDADITIEWCGTMYDTGGVTFQYGNQDNSGASFGTYVHASSLDAVYLSSIDITDLSSGVDVGTAKCLTWTHNQTYVCAYRDGVLDKCEAKAMNIASTTMRLGQRFDAGDGMPCDNDHLTIWDDALTSVQVLESYNCFIAGDDKNSDCGSSPPVNPNITLGYIHNTFNGTLLNITPVIEYYDGVYRLNFTYYDNDASNITARIYNSSGNVIYYNSSYSMGYVDVDSELMVDFDGNPYNFTLSVLGNDTGESSKSALFNLSDTSIPLIDGADDITIAYNTTYSFNITGSDEYLWSFNISCDNGIQYNISGLASQEFNFTWSFDNVTSTFICTYHLFDGHTANVMQPIDIYVDPSEKVLTFEGMTLSTEQQLKDISIEQHKDKISFCLEPIAKVNELDVNIPHGFVIAPDSKWQGHYVNLKERLAIDFESSQAISVINQFKDSIELDVSRVKESNICFDSIVELNEVTGSFTVSVSPPETDTMYTYELNTNSIGSVMLLFTLFFFMLGLWIVAYVFRSRSFAVFGFIIGVITGLLLISFSVYLTIVFSFINIAILWEFTKRF